MTTFCLPDLGEGLKEARVTSWQCQPGDRVRQGDEVLSVETAKAIVDIPAPEDLIVTALHAAVEDMVSVGAPLFDFRAAKEIPETPSTGGSVVGRLAEAGETAAERRLLIGDQAFTDAEVREALARLATGSPGKTRTEDGGLRLGMARAMEHAGRQVVQATVFDEVALSRKTAGRDILPRVLTALVAACREHPLLNARYDANRLTPSDRVHLGLAVDTPHGLLVPVIPDAGDISAARWPEAVRQARESALAGTPGDSRLPATITVSNFGALGGRFATPLVMPPQVAILGVGRLYTGWRRGRKGKPKVALMLPLSLGFDHRALTGGEAARFLQSLIRHLSEPPDCGA